MPELRCIVVTPEATVLDEAADFVALPLYDGEIGISPGHSPMLGRLGYGEMRIGRVPRAASYYVDGGFVEVAGDVVSVLTGRAVPAAELSADHAAEQLAAAFAETAHGEDQLAVRDRRIAQARAQLHLARRASV